MSHPTIHYTPLSSAHEIRLLRVQPGSGSDNIKCTLHSSQLNHELKYEALSYMWGPSHCLQSVEVNGQACAVRENLWQALKHLRSRHEERMLWIDALCINQDDDLERNHQVAQMGAIYRQAENVCVWLGKANTSSRVAFNFLELLSSKKWMKILEKKRIPKTGFRHCWTALNRLLQRPYWGRLWVIQEIVLASRIDVYCGDDVIDWESLSTVLILIASFRGEDWRPIHREFGVSIGNSVAARLCRQRMSQVGQKVNDTGITDSLFLILYKYRDANCMESRDKIFGLHSLAPECCRAAVPVDYTCASYDLYSMLLKHHVFHGDNGLDGDGELFMKQLRTLHRAVVGRESNQAIAKSIHSANHPKKRIEELKKGNKNLSGCLRVQLRIANRIRFLGPSISADAPPNGSIWIPFRLFHFLDRKLEARPYLTQRTTRAVNLVSEIDINGLSHYLQTHTSYIEDVPYQIDDRGYFVPAGHPLIELLRSASEQLGSLLKTSPQATSKNLAVFFDFDGSIGFAPANARNGDIICNLGGESGYLILREVGEECEVIGRAMYLTPAFPVGKGKVSFKLNVEALQFLTDIPESSHDGLTERQSGDKDAFRRC